jgi:hypothetical protein
VQILIHSSGPVTSSFDKIAWLCDNTIQWIFQTPHHTTFLFLVVPVPES